MTKYQNKILTYAKFILFFFIFTEIVFQFLFFINSKVFSRPILFYNPYCHQEYWDGNKSSYNMDIYTYHPSLSIVKKNQFFQSKESKIKKDNNLIFYGSSFIDHEIFINLFPEEKNYAVKSYGLDQIYLSYLLTKDEFIGSTLIFGFLPEDLDRIIFHKRNYNKVKYTKEKDQFIASNLPINLSKDSKMKSDFFTYRFLVSISYLFMNNFDYKKSECKSELKKNFFIFIMKNIIDHAKKNNQNLIFVTFNFQEDINNETSWRYKFIRDFLKKNDILHIDTKKIIESDIEQNQSQVNDYFSDIDLHYNEKANIIIAREIRNLIELYK